MLFWEWVEALSQFRNNRAWSFEQVLPSSRTKASDSAAEDAKKIARIYISFALSPQLPDYIAKLTELIHRKEDFRSLLKGNLMQAEEGEEKIHPRNILFSVFSSSWLWASGAAAEKANIDFEIIGGWRDNLRYKEELNSRLDQ